MAWPQVLFLVWAALWCAHAAVARDVRSVLRVCGLVSLLVWGGFFAPRP